jgi:hypothetical protein
MFNNRGSQMGAALPSSVQEIAEVIGRDAALRLVGALPRCSQRDRRYPNAASSRVIMYVPKRVEPGHRLVQILGHDTARRLVHHFGGEVLYPANCADVYRRFRDSEALRMVRDGMPAKAVADVLGVSDRHVRNLLREIPQEEMRAANDNNPGE